MDIAIVDEKNIITNVVIFDEPAFEEDETHKFLTPGLWIGDTYSKEIPKNVASEIEANKIIDQSYSSISKLELVEQLASLIERLDEQEEA